MPPILLGIFVFLAVVALIPLSIVQRFRGGVARRQARGWVAALNLAGVALSAVLGYYLVFWAGVHSHVRRNARA